MASEIRNRKSKIENRNPLAGVQFCDAGQAGLQSAPFALRRFPGDARFSVRHLPVAAFAAALSTESTVHSPQPTAGSAVGRGTNWTVDYGPWTERISRRHFDFPAGRIGALDDSIRPVLQGQGFLAGFGRRPDRH